MAQILASVPEPYLPPLHGSAGSPILHGTWEVEPADGIVVVSVSPPALGAFDPQPVFTYSSESPASSELGFGWFHTFAGSVTPKVIA